LPEKQKKAKRERNSKHNKEFRAKRKEKNKRREQAKKSRKRAIRRNKKYVETCKIENPCPCGETEICCLTFHHDNGEKSGNVSDMVNRGYSINRIQKEIKKCKVLCLNCHAKFHNKDKTELKLVVLKKMG